ncbi:MAG: TIGR00297 family protein [Merismopedia sp. SIO2A8]|nr:TIGR00297 family protein [Merismopedia sp. SIO2A8]
MDNSDLPLIYLGILIGLLAIAAIMIPKKLLTNAGLIHAWSLGIIIWGTLGWQGYTVILFYFLVGSAVTRVGMAEKEAAGIAEKRSGARGPENVWGSALTGTLCALGVWGINHWEMRVFDPWAMPLLLGYIASLSTKLSDTCASEVGKAYGQRTFLITTLKPVPRGTEGAVSLEGTLAGVVASIAIALVGWLLGLITATGILICAIAAFVATNIESVIGATLQDRLQWLTNEIVNIINTTVGAGVAMAIMIALEQVKG